MIARCVAILALLAAAGCGNSGPETVSLASRARIAPETARYFLSLYEGAETPPKLQPIDYRSRWNRLSEPDRERFMRAVRHNSELYGYFVADLDDDGTIDWIWDQTTGVFVPNDSDFDGDGTGNFLDPAPYDSRAGLKDTDRDGLPDHLDWDADGDGEPDKLPEVAGADTEGVPGAHTDASSDPDTDDAAAVAPETRAVEAAAALADAREAVRLQAEILRRTGIYAFHQTGRHDVRSLRTFLEQVTSVYGKILEDNGGKLPSLRYLIADEDTSSRNLPAWYNRENHLIALGETYRGLAMTYPHFYESTIIHEVAHAVDAYFRGIPELDSVRSSFLNYFWKGDRFRGKDRLELSAESWFSRIRSEVDPDVNPFQNELDTESARRNHILSRYALTGPAEYFAVSIEAYVFRIKLLRILDTIEDPAERRRVHAQLAGNFMRETRIHYRNLAPEGRQVADRLLNLSRRLKWVPEVTAGRAVTPIANEGEPERENVPDPAEEDSGSAGSTGDSVADGSSPEAGDAREGDSNASDSEADEPQLPEYPPYGLPRGRWEYTR